MTEHVTSVHNVSDTTGDGEPRMQGLSADNSCHDSGIVTNSHGQHEKKSKGHTLQSTGVSPNPCYPITSRMLTSTPPEAAKQRLMASSPQPGGTSPGVRKRTIEPPRSLSVATSNRYDMRTQRSDPPKSSKSLDYGSGQVRVGVMETNLDDVVLDFSKMKLNTARLYPEPVSKETNIDDISVKSLKNQGNIEVLAEPIFNPSLRNETIQRSDKPSLNDNNNRGNVEIAKHSYKEDTTNKLTSSIENSNETSKNATDASVRPFQGSKVAYRPSVNLVDAVQWPSTVPGKLTFSQQEVFEGKYRLNFNTELLYQT